MSKKVHVEVTSILFILSRITMVCLLFRLSPLGIKNPTRHCLPKTAGDSDCLEWGRKFRFGFEFSRKGWMRWNLGENMSGKILDNPSFCRHQSHRVFLLLTSMFVRLDSRIWHSCCIGWYTDPPGRVLPNNGISGMLAEKVAFFR